jgi:hypothetical protein
VALNAQEVASTPLNQPRVFSFATTGVFVLAAAQTTQNDSKTAAVLDCLIADPLSRTGKLVMRLREN